VYNITTPIIETPPRPALQRFGGVFNPRSFCQPAECRLIQPPFVSYCMLVEENAKYAESEMPQLPVVPMQVEEADAFDEPCPPALYTKFVIENDTSEAAASNHPKSGVQGSLEKFSQK